MSKVFSRLPRQIENAVNRQIANEKILVYSKQKCPFALKAKQMLLNKGLTPTVVELDTIESGKMMQDALENITGQRTVPNIFVGGMHVGGWTRLESSEKYGVLDSMLKVAGVIQPFGIPVKRLDDTVWQKEGYGDTFVVGDDDFNVTVSKYGASLVSLKFKSKEMSLNWDPKKDPGQMVSHDANPYYGATCGRVAGRIENAKFTLPNGKKISLAQNDGRNALHGGINNFARIKWDKAEKLSNHKLSVNIEG
jgi:glutaredoxin 3